MKKETNLWIANAEQDFTTVEILLPINGAFREIIPAATDLTDFATSTRYPVSEEDVDIFVARDAYKAMIEIKSFVLSKINSD